MIYVVLGCHKSGTSLIAEILHRSGIAMVEGEVGETDYDRGDFFERLDWVYLNQDILGFGNPVPISRRPPAYAPRMPRAADIDQKIEACEKQHESWGFKDPRTCLTYPIWKEHLPTHSVIGVYRPLAEFWAHETRVGWRPSLWKTIRTWCEYNRRLAEATREA